MTVKAERKELSHEAILQSAARLVRQKGIAGARVADVMAGAGLTVGGFYAHFASKTELVDEALRRTGAKLRGELFAPCRGGPPGLDVILERYLSTGHRDMETQGCPLPAVVGEVATSASEHRTAVREQVMGLADGIRLALPAAHELGPRRLSLALVALMYGGLTLARAVKGTRLSSEILEACRALGAFAVRDDSGE